MHVRCMTHLGLPKPHWQVATARLSCRIWAVRECITACLYRAMRGAQSGSSKLTGHVLVSEPGPACLNGWGP